MKKTCYIGFIAAAMALCLYVGIDRVATAFQVRTFQGPTQLIAYPVLAEVVGSDQTVSVSQTFNTKAMNGAATIILNVDSVTGGQVDLVYEVSYDNVNWFSPDSPTLASRTTTGDTVKSVTLIATPWLRVKTNVTPTIQYDAIIMAN